MSKSYFMASGAIVALTLGLSVTTASAQAWVGDGQSLSTSLDYSYSRSDRVPEGFGVEVAPNDDISSHIVAFGVEYAPIDKLALQVTVPLVTTLYFGDPETASFPPHGRYDDGNYHTVLQDFRFGGRYMVLEQPVALSPHLGISIPMTNYETIGYAGAGRGLNQLHVGFSVGKFFTSGLPDSYVHLQYEFSLGEGYETAYPDTAEFGQVKSDFKLLGGYFINEELEVNLGIDARIPHGGMKFEEFGDVSVGAQHHHDALLAESFFLVGAGVSYQVTDALRVSALIRLFVAGAQTRDANIVGIGVGWDVM